ncbi:hypothetical protein GSI_09806 [Ganoderma sinense ZZ0214-1]|uniref:Uncharacterized protein n=1 Tax=Ganoderma sinense ZZ0214-1 TaxID=1077348 RepID=A0A2G8S2S9_9APHY|nr:hypothetical protein GSI_09806 [Ganoderma sinense ZZ0214-1]
MARRCLRGYFVAKTGSSQAEKLFAILIESGAVYCSIWTVIVAYQVTKYYTNNTFSPESKSEVSFLSIFGVIMSGMFVPVIAIYPTLIIVLVASNRSHVEKGLAPSAEPIPMSTRTGDTATAAHSKTRPGQRSSVLLIDRQQQDCEDSMMDDASTSTREEWKLERLM